MMENRKTIMITGASKGFGFEMVRVALANGNKVIATVRSEPEKLADQMDQANDLLVLVMDVTDENAVRSAIEKGIAQFGHIDTLINNAGYGLLGAVEEATDAEVRKQYDTNVFGLLNVIRAILPSMRERRSGHIINISSIMGFDAAAGWTIYSSTKFAVEGISSGLHKELLPLGIKVTALAPGLFSTDFLGKGSFAQTAASIADYFATVGETRDFASRHHGKQPGDPQKLAGLAIMIAQSEKPPLHLLVGKDAIARYRANAKRVSDEVAVWLALSESTGHI